SPLILLIADDSTAGTFWRQDTAAGPVLERGPELVRAARIAGSSLHLTGDTSSARDLEVWAPAGVRSVIWNGAPVTTRPTSAGSPGRARSDERGEPARDAAARGTHPGPPPRPDARHVAIRA